MMSSIMRESHIMKIHYLTALIAVGFVIIHIMIRVHTWIIRKFPRV